MKEIIRKRYIYPEVHKKELLKNFAELFPDEKALEETFFSFYDNWDMMTSRPLAKLTKDILEQLKNEID